MEDFISPGEMAPKQSRQSLIESLGLDPDRPLALMSSKRGMGQRRSREWSGLSKHGRVGPQHD